MGAWRYARASVTGTSHDRSGRPCQDTGVCTVFDRPGVGHVLVAAVSDGAGSAAHSDLGSAFACWHFVDWIERLYRLGCSAADLSADRARTWLAAFQRAIADRAAVLDLAPRDFACTFLGAVVESEIAVFFQIGDGVIVLSDDLESDSYVHFVWPETGEYANTTFFATGSDAAHHLRFDKIARPVDEVALLTDGLQGLALRYESRLANAPFFRPFFAAVRGEPAGESAGLSRSLAAFLGSPRVNDRTDDDKTLVIATRRAQPAPARQPEPAAARRPDLVAAGQPVPAAAAPLDPDPVSWSEPAPTVQPEPPAPGEPGVEGR